MPHAEPTPGAPRSAGRSAPAFPPRSWPPSPRREKGVRLRRAVVDRFDVLPRDSVIGEDPEEDGRRYVRDGAGIVVIPRGDRVHVVDLEESP